ncbi:hypothetical protein SASPL_155971 [Salvia splendens]|uniref:Uncharacterized protein n=1 Tax=Salvia splendens TaxID=180675 RepID=A0A8X8VXU7_SALSN|nr:hypothetical protein SASPL_155971 [Salvia splendens]
MMSSGNLGNKIKLRGERIGSAIVALLPNMLKSVNGYAISNNAREVVLTKALLHLQRIKGMGYGSSAITYDNIMGPVLVALPEIRAVVEMKSATSRTLTREKMSLCRRGLRLSSMQGKKRQLPNLGTCPDPMTCRSLPKQVALLPNMLKSVNGYAISNNAREVVLTKALLHLQRIKGMGYGSSAITYDNIMVLVPNILLIGYYQKGLPDKSDALLWDIINREEIPTSLQKSCESVAHAKRLKEDSMLLLRLLSCWSFGFFMVYGLGAGCIT